MKYLKQFLCGANILTLLPFYLAVYYSKDKKYLKTFASYDENEESFSDRNVFPIGCIKEMKKIEI